MSDDDREGYVVAGGLFICAALFVWDGIEKLATHREWPGVMYLFVAAAWVIVAIGRLRRGHRVKSTD